MGGRTGSSTVTCERGPSGTMFSKASGCGRVLERKSVHASDDFAIEAVLEQHRPTRRPTLPSASSGPLALHRAHMCSSTNFPEIERTYMSPHRGRSRTPAVGSPHQRTPERNTRGETGVAHEVLAAARVGLDLEWLVDGAEQVVRDRKSVV